MNACILAVGSEMLTPFRVDTNSLLITERLNVIGYDVRLKAVVADHVDELVRVFEGALGWADLIIVTGGLGPTEDDITRDAVARVLDAPMAEDERIVAKIQERFARRGMKMSENNRRQAMVPRGAEVLENDNGTAPGLWLTKGRTSIALLPGPPREMTPMLEATIRDRLAPKAAGGGGLFRRVLKITGRPESEVDAIAAPIYKPWATAPVPIDTTILAALGQIELHLTARARDKAAADAALAAAVAQLHGALGLSVYGTDGRPLEAVVGGMLRERGMTIAVAESCSGGLLASRLTDVPGSSDYVERGVVCYSNRAKVDLGVPADLITQHGAVSEPVARAMAEQIRAQADTDVGVGITGIAGPGGATPGKPVGTVAIAVLAGPKGPAPAEGPACSVRTFQFFGGRDMVKFQSAQAAMNMLRLMLLKSDTPFWPAQKR